MKRTIPKTILIALLTVCSSAFAANPDVVNGVATYHSNKNIGRKFQAPDSWDKIVIKKNVTLTGSFYFPTRTKPIEIAGESRETSIIIGDGSRPTDDGIKGRSYSAIRCDKSPDVYIHDLRSLDPMKFHISAGFGNVKVERCDLIERRGTHTTDGVHGGRNKTQVIDCYIDTHDDALYISECFLVKNCTIVNNHNGAPFQVGWGKDIGVDSCRIENCVVIDAHKGPQPRYFMGVVGWANRSGTRPNTMNITFVNFKREVRPGALVAPMYQFGRGNKGIENCTINVKGYCDPDDVVEFYVSKNCEFNQDCSTNEDSEKPTKPGAPTFSNITENSVKVDWSASTDNVGVTGYDVFVNNSKETTVSGTSATISGLTCNTAYNVKVRATDAAGNLSVFSNTETVTTAACAPGDEFNDITDLTAEATACDQVVLAWTDNSTGESGYRVRRKISGAAKFTTLGDVPANSESYTDNAVNEGTSYIYQVRALNNGVAVKASNNPEVSVPNCGDTEAPTVPTGLSASNITETSVTISWNPSSDNVGVDGYKVFEGAAVVANVSGTSATITGLTCQTTHTYQVAAYDAVGNESAKSAGITITTSNCAPQDEFNDITDLTAEATACDQVVLTWTDNSTGESGFRVRRKISGAATFTTLGDVPANSESYTDNAVNEGTSYIYQVRALNNGVAVKASNNPEVTTPDCGSNPVPFGNLTQLKANATSCTQVKLTWEAMDADKFIVRRKLPGGSYSNLKTVNAPATSYTDNTAKANTTYIYQVRPQKGSTKKNSNKPQIKTPACPKAASVELGDNSNVNIYPNPAADAFTVEFTGKENASISLINTAGKVVNNLEIFEGINQIDVSSYERGMYIVVVRTANSVENHIIILE